MECAELIEKLKRGQESAFEELCSLYQRQIYRLAIYYLKNRMDAEEVVQEVLLTTFLRIKEFQGRSSLGTWIYRVTVNACLMRLRSRKRENHLNFEMTVSDFEKKSHKELDSYLTIDWVRLKNDSMSPTKKLLQKEFFEKLEQLGEEMGPIRWETFLWKEVFGFTETEISKKFKLSPSAVKSRLHRSKAFLKKRFQPYLQE